MQGKQVKTNAAKVGKLQKDRYGMAIVSLIMGIFSAILFILGIMNLAFEIGMAYSGFYSTGGVETGTIYFLFSIIFALIGFPLGFMARKSPKGRGMAIAAMTLTFLPLLLFLIIIFVSLFNTIRYYIF